MKHFRTTCAVSALISAAFAQGAAADITADEAWTSLRDMLTGSGYSVDSSESREGNALVVSDLVFTMVSEVDTGTTSVDFGTLRFVETGDGAVRVEMPGVLPVTSTFTDPDTGQPVTVNIDITQAGAQLVMSGTPERITQSYSAETVGIAMTSFDAPGADIPPDAIRLSATIAAPSSTSILGQGEPRPVEMSATAESASFDMAFEVPGESKATAAGQMGALTFTGSGALPTNTDGGDLYAMMEAGYRLQGTFSHDGGAMQLSGEEEGQSFTAETSSDSGQLDMAVSGDSLTYDIRQTGTSITALLAELPFPLSIQAAALQAGVTLPVSPGDEPKDFNLLVNLEDFVMSDMIWAMLDPQSILPRDPATLLVDLAGKAKVFTDLLDPNLATKLEDTGEMPGQLEALDINAVRLDMVGAELNGTGAFTFDNSDTASFGGYPRPVGKLNLSLKGGNGLLDKLSQMGLIGPQEAGSARMMMGLFGVPGDAPDTLNSTLEINEQGHISANGQRIQ